MKKKLLFVLSLLLVFNSFVFTFADDTLNIESVVSKSNINVGDRFYVDFKVVDNPTGYNSMTAFVKYDSNVIRPVECAVSDIPSDLIVYKNSTGFNYSLFPYSFINSRIKFVPSVSDTDYDGLADGVKTAGEIGIIKVAAYLNQSVNTYLQNYSGTGTLLRLKFEAVAEGSTGVELQNPGTAYYVQGKSYNLNTDIKNSIVSVGSKQTITGDVNDDGVVLRNDLTMLARYFAGASVEIDTSNSDINKDGRISRNDLVELSKYFAGWNVGL